MSIGMKRGTVYLEAHQSAWEQSAAETAAALYAALSGLHIEIQHVGSTAIRTIKAKPIIDIAVAAADFDEILARNAELAAHQIIFRLDERPRELLYVKGDLSADTRTHHIHVVRMDSQEWQNYLNFRDYLNANAEAASEYEAWKERLAAQYPADRNAYTDGKSEIIARFLREAAEWRTQMQNT